MEIEHVTRIGLTARRTAQQQRHLTIGCRLLGQIVIDDQPCMPLSRKYSPMVQPA